MGKNNKAMGSSELARGGLRLIARHLDLLSPPFQGNATRLCELLLKP